MGRRRGVAAEDLFGPAYGSDALFDLTPQVTNTLTRPRISPAVLVGGVVPPPLPPEWREGTCLLHLPRWDMGWEAARGKGRWPKVNPKTGKVVKRRKVWDALQGNSRVHFQQRAAATREVIAAIAEQAKAAGLETCSYLTVRLVRVVPTNRAMDEDNLWPFFKVCCDALARGPRKDIPGLHLVPDDTPQWMNKLTPRIIHRRGETGLWLEITPGNG